MASFKAVEERKQAWCCFGPLDLQAKLSGTFVIEEMKKDGDFQ